MSFAGTIRARSSRRREIEKREKYEGIVRAEGGIVRAKRRKARSTEKKDNRSQ